MPAGNEESLDSQDCMLASSWTMISTLPAQSRLYTTSTPLLADHQPACLPFLIQKQISLRSTASMSPLQGLHVLADPKHPIATLCARMKRQIAYTQRIGCCFDLDADSNMPLPRHQVPNCSQQPSLHTDLPCELSGAGWLMPHSLHDNTTLPKQLLEPEGLCLYLNGLRRPIPHLCVSSQSAGTGLACLVILSHLGNWVAQQQMVVNVPKIRDLNGPLQCSIF